MVSNKMREKKHVSRWRHFLHGILKFVFFFGFNICRFYATDLKSNFNATDKSPTNQQSYLSIYIRKYLYM